MEFFPVIGCAVNAQDDFRFLAAGDPVIELCEYRGHRVAESIFPVKGAALRRGAAIGVHPVHAVLGDQGHQALGQLFHGLIECLAGTVAPFAQLVVLGFQDARQTSHQHTPFARQVAVDFLLECRGE